MTEKQLIDFYRKAIGNTVKNHHLDSGDKLFAHFLNKLPNVYTQAVWKEIKTNKNISFNFIEVYKTQAAFTKLVFAFAKRFPEFYNDYYSNKLSEFQKAYFIDVCNNDSLSQDLRIEFANYTLLDFNDTYFVATNGEKRKEAKAIKKFIQNKIAELEKIKQKTHRNVSFTLNLTFKQRNQLKYKLQKLKYTSMPQKFIDVLSGAKTEVEVEPDKLHHIAYLLFRLNKIKPQLLSINYTRGVFSHFQTHVSRYNSIAGKRDLRVYKREVVRDKGRKEQIIKEVDVIIAALIKE